MTENYRKLTNETLLISTTNQGKIAEFKRIISSAYNKITTLSDFDLAPPIEDGKDFFDNAKIKAKYYSQKTNMLCLADDSGLCIEALDGEPGIYSADWAGTPRNFDIAIKKIQQKLADKNLTTSKAFFTCVLCIYWPDGHYHFFEGKLNGNINFLPKGKYGHGYDPIFVPDGFKETFAQITISEKNKISHRSKALEQFFNSCI